MRTLLISIVSTACCCAALAEDRTAYSWRGIGSTGVFPAGDLVTEFWDIPDYLSEEQIFGSKPQWSKVPKEAKPGSSKNIVWRTLLPHLGHNAPVVMGDRVYLLCDEGAVSDAPLLVCLDVLTGDIKWQKPVDHLDAWPAAEQKAAKAARAIELKRWREHMTWWNKLYWNDETNGPAKHDQATWDRIAGEALAAGWKFCSHAEAKLNGPADCGNGAYRGRYGRKTGRMNGAPTDASITANIAKVYEERIYWRPGWTSEGPFYHSTMGSVVGDGTHIYAVTAFGGAAAYTPDGELAWLVDLGIAPQKSGLPCHEKYIHYAIASPVLADGHLVYYSRDMGIMYGVDCAKGTLAWQVETPRTENTDPKGGKAKSARGYALHMAPGGTPVVLDLAGTAVVVSGHGMAVRVADGKLLGQVAFPPGKDAKGKPIGPYSCTYNSWTGAGDLLYAQHARGVLCAFRLGIDGDQLSQEVVWTSKLVGDNRNPNLVLTGKHLLAGPLSVPGEKDRRKARKGFCALDLTTGAIARQLQVGIGGYNTSLGVTADLLISRRGGWSKGNSRYTSYAIASLADGKALSDGVLGNPPMSEEVKERHRGVLGAATIVWGPAGITCWGNRIFIRNNDYLWCIGDPDKEWVPPERYLR